MLLFGTMRLRAGGFGLVAIICLIPSVFFLTWLMFLEWLRCVVALWLMQVAQLFATIAYMYWRWRKYGSAWLEYHREDNPEFDMDSADIDT